VLYELLTGETAYPHGPGTRRPRPAYAIASDVPAALDRVLRRATEAAPDQRFASAAELSAALLEAIAPARPAEPAEVVAFLRVVCPTQMGDAPPNAAEVPEPEPATAEQTVAEGISRRRDSG
jgi:serine/threonine-protein kinase